MKLSELIAYRNQLLALDIDNIEYTAARKLADILHVVKTSVIQPRAFTQTLGEDNTNIINGFKDFNSTFSELVQELNAMIEVVEKSYYIESSRLYQEESPRYNIKDPQANDDVNQQILNRRLVMTSGTQQMLAERIKSYVDWKYSALIIRPGLEKFVDDMVGFDPLYMVDYSKDLLAPAQSSFTTEYKRRLRLLVDPPLSVDVLASVPKNQLGLCLAFNFFEFTPIEVIEQYLKEIFSKLRPGGTLAMTFNDCDRAHCVALAEQHYRSYTPGARISLIAKTIGYKQIFSWNDGGDFNWLELRKSGELSSLKGGQTLAKIIPKSLAKSK
jgi:SAM-dependent methyltransferase